MSMTHSQKTNIHPNELQEYTFPVVGTSYRQGAYEHCARSSTGVPLELKADPTNAFDKYAIEVYLDDVFIGFVPNKGYSCSKCWSHVESNLWACSNCGAPNKEFVEGGLARRLTERDILNQKFGCYISKLNVLSKSVPVTAKLVAANIY